MPMPTRWTSALTTLAAVTAFAGAAVLTLLLILDSARLKALELDLAEVRDVRYGLLDADQWVSQLTAILDRRIEAFELTEENRPVIKRNVERVLDRLLLEIEAIQRRQNRAGGSWLDRVQGALRQGVQDFVIDFDELRARVPFYAERVLEELSTPEAKADLRAQLRAALAELAAETFAETDRAAFDAVLGRHGCEGVADCARVLEPRIAEARERVELHAAAAIALVVLLFALMRLRRGLGPTPMRLMTAATLVLLAGGVLTPMISIEAEITELRLQILGEPVVFRDQIVYFQMKSVLDVVETLARTGDADMILVAGLVALFSVLFPLAKVIAGFLYWHDWHGLRASPTVRFFALKSGKWSMADVLVVAMFMAFVGFRGLVASQLGNLAGGGPTVDVLTTNGTALEMGFYLFLAFVLASLVLSTLLDARLGERHVT
jgi:hypothetical protein